MAHTWPIQLSSGMAFAPWKSFYLGTLGYSGLLPGLFTLQVVPLGGILHAICGWPAPFHGSSIVKGQLPAMWVLSLHPAARQAFPASRLPFGFFWRKPLTSPCVPQTPGSSNGSCEAPSLSLRWGGFSPRHSGGRMACRTQHHDQKEALALAF